MAEATREASTYGLEKAVGKGHRLWAGKLAISDDETLDTGLDTIEGMGCVTTEDTDIDDDSPLVFVKSIGSGASSGIITFMTGKVGLYTNVTDVVAYMLVVGTARGGIAT